MSQRRERGLPEGPRLKLIRALRLVLDALEVFGDTLEDAIASTAGSRDLAVAEVHDAHLDAVFAATKCVIALVRPDQDP